MNQCLDRRATAEVSYACTCITLCHQGSTLIILSMHELSNQYEYVRSALISKFGREIFRAITFFILNEASNISVRF